MHSVFLTEQGVGGVVLDLTDAYPLDGAGSGIGFTIRLVKYKFVTLYYEASLINPL